MATDTLQTESARATTNLREIACELIEQSSRIRSLGIAIDGTIDFPTSEPDRLRALESTLDYLHLIEEANAKVRACAEQVEEFAFEAKGQRQ